jgi:hypothetical protein
MVTKQSLQEKYSEFETGDLLEISSSKTIYTAVAISTALRELRKRDVPEDVIKNYKSVFSYIPDKEELEQHITDLNIFQKLLYYILIIPQLRQILNGLFIEENCLLKSQQSNYYMVLSVSFLILTAILMNLYKFPFLPTWLSGFIPGYLFDIAYNKQRQIIDIQRRIAERKDIREF